MKTSASQPASCCAGKPAPVQPSLQDAVRARWRGLDKPSLLAILIVLGLALWRPEQLPATLAFTGRSLASIAPWIALSVLLAAYASASRADAVVARAFSGSPRRMIVLASLFGALSPFCSCGVVPLIAGLLGAGVPLAPVMAFWLSSPLMDPNMLVMTAASLGMEFALVKTLAAIGMGLFSGAATHALTKRGYLADALRHVPSGAGAALASVRPQWNVMASPHARGAFVAGAASNGWFLLRWMTIAFLLESLMVAYLPADKVVRLLGQDASAIPLAVMLGIPAYLNGFAALPLVRGLVDMGMSPAVALAFLAGGGVTSIPAATAVWALVKPRVFALYLALAVAGSLAAAYAYSAWLALG
ncbi:MAG TPA: permease [Noviherbaspirillum sp.]|uniref:permease n=1 Tax=Noviherbaspirillum sp. TaxID=1926288 RepID=UPI002D5EBC19|nr:permease [Noviherbaspirillum sp.]HYD96014.1 permease [Noviherbaspirillum sp.]